MNPTSSLANAYHPILDDRWRGLAGDGEHRYRVDALGREGKIIRAFSAREASSLFSHIRSLCSDEASAVVVRRTRQPECVPTTPSVRAYFDFEF